MNRTDHETLIEGDDVKTTSIILMFFNLFRNFKIRDDKLRGYGFDSYIQSPLTYEENDSDKKIPQSLVDKLEDILADLKPGNPVTHTKLLRDFVDEFKQTKFDFKFPDNKILYEYSIKALNDCFKLFGNLPEIKIPVVDKGKTQDVSTTDVGKNQNNIEEINAEDWK